MPDMNEEETRLQIAGLVGLFLVGLLGPGAIAMLATQWEFLAPLWMIFFVLPFFSFLVCGFSIFAIDTRIREHRGKQPPGGYALLVATVGALACGVISAAMMWGACSSHFDGW